MKTALRLCVGTIVTVFGMSSAWASPPVTASSVGARLNSVLLKGGGIDDTRLLQAVLDRAADGTPVHLIIDGVALISGLNVHGNTTLECSAGSGLYLKDGANRAILRNANRSRGAVTDHRITIRGCFLNGNRDRQVGAVHPVVDMPWARGPSKKEADGTFISGLQFLGVRDLIIEDVTLWNVRAFGALIANASHVNIRNVVVDCGTPAGTDCPPNTDGFHFKGPLQHVSINNTKFRVGDDSLAFNPNDSNTADLTVRNDFGPYVGLGPITDVIVSDLHLVDTALGMRFLSSTERIDRIVVSNVTGTIRGGYLANFSHWMNPERFGNIGAITIQNVNVDRAPLDPAMAKQLKEYFKFIETQGAPGREYLKEWNGGDMPYISINVLIESLTLRGIVTKVPDERPIVRIGPDAHVQALNVELSLLDPAGQATPMLLNHGGRVDNLAFALDWDQGRPPIISQGGNVGSLRWIDTPPKYNAARMTNGDTVTIVFTQDIKAPDFAGGASVEVNGRPAAIKKVTRAPTQSNAVDYVLKARVRPGDDVTWSYDAAAGHIQNLSGTHLLSVSAKPVQSGE